MHGTGMRARGQDQSPMLHALPETMETRENRGSSKDIRQAASTLHSRRLSRKVRSQGLCRHHWYIAHKDEVREYAIEHRERRAELGRGRRAYFREYHKLHPEKVRAWSHKRRELKTSGVQHTGADEIHVYNLAEGKCAYCGTKLSFKEGQIDHIVPLSRGGSNDIGNLAWSCPHCNNKKNAKFIIEVKYAQKRTKMSQ